uniref:Uncharacterized protein n=1 Tax=viral metagenome TaxID=1070528 RepID=A0A6M3JTJ7_9ZZZZ
MESCDIKVCPFYNKEIVGGTNCEDKKRVETCSLKIHIGILEEQISSAVQPRVSQGEEMEVGVLLPKLNKRLAIYQKAINEMDDYFEYRYAQFDREEIRKYVYDVLDSLAKKLEATKTGYWTSLDFF